MLLITHAGTNLPIEAKRQILNYGLPSRNRFAGYAADEGAFGYGVLVRKRPQGVTGKRPESAEELEAMLPSDLPSTLDGKITVIVLDVSRPAKIRTGM